MKKRYVALGLLLFLVIGFGFHAITPNAYAAAATGEKDSGDSGGGSILIPNWVEDVINSVKNMTKSFEDLMSGQLIKDAIDGLVVKMVDDMLTPLFGAFGKSFLFTPRVAEIGLVYRTWSTFTIIGLVAIMAGVGVLAWKVISGKKEMKRLLIGFIVSFFAIIFSLTILNFLNVGVNWLTQSSLEGIVGEEKIDYQGLTGEEVLKAIIIGADAITDPAYAGQSLGQLTVESEGGIFTLLIVCFFEIMPLFLVSVMKTLLLMILAMFVAGWIAVTAYTGKLETLVGFGNIYIRTLLVGLACALYWGIFVRSQTNYGSGMGLSSDIGVPPIVFGVLSVIALLIAFYFFWIRPVWQAMLSPMTLGGAVTVERAGQWGERLSNGLNRTGKRLGMEGLQKRSLGWAEKSRQISDVGQRMKQAASGKGIMGDRLASDMTLGTTEALRGVNYEEPTEWMRESGSVVVTETPSITASGEQLIMSDAAHIRRELTPKGFTSSALIHFPAEQHAGMADKVQALQKKFGEEALQWHAASGQLFVRDQVDPIVKELGNHQLFASKIHHGLAKDGAFVDLMQKKVTTLDPTKSAKAAADAIHKALPSYERMQVPAGKSELLHKHLQEQPISWAKDVQLRDDEIWVPAKHAVEAQKVLADMSKETVRQVRYDMPKGSSFLEGMVNDWKKSGTHTTLLSGMQVEVGSNHLLLKEEYSEAFAKAFEAYRKDRTPFWRTKNGTIKVIKDGVPVDYGRHAPVNGMDMGSFEKLQQDMLMQHRAGGEA